MFRFKPVATALLAIWAFQATRAADAGRLGGEPQLKRKADTDASVSTYNPGTQSQEATSISSQGYRVNNMIYLSGQYSYETDGVVVHEGDFSAQARQTLKNVDRVLAGFKVGRRNIAELVVYLTNPRAQSEPLIALLQEYVGHHRPAVTVIGTTGLFFPQQLIEIRVVAYTD